MARRVTRLTAFTIALFSITAVGQAKPPNTLTYRDCFARSGPPCPGQTSTGLYGIADVSTSADGRFAYVSGQAGRLGIFRRNPRTGAMTDSGCLSATPTAGCTVATGLDDARVTAVAPDGRDAYTVGGGNRTLVTFRRDGDTGALTKTGCLQWTQINTCSGSPQATFNGISDVAVSPDGRSVYTAAESGGVTTFARDRADGHLTQTGCVQGTGGDAPGTCPTVPGLAGAHSVAVSPDGSAVYVASYAADAITAFSRDPATGALTRSGCIQNTGGADCDGATAAGLDGATDVAVSPDDRSVYAASGLSDAITRFDRTPGSAALTSQGCVQNTGGSACAATAPALDGAVRVVVSPDGQTVYVGAQAGQGGFAAFVRTQATGALGSPTCVSAGSGCATVSSTAGQVLGLAVTSDSASLLVASQDNDVLGNWAREQPPVCLPTTTGGPGAVSVTLDCYDPNGTATDIAAVSGPTNGSLGAVDQGTNRVTYTPRAGFSGVDSFTYRSASDGLTSVTATATVMVPAAASTVGPPAAAPTITALRRDPLFAMLAASTASARQGKRATVAFAATRAGKATLRIKRKGKTVATLTRTLKKAGRSTVTWNGRVKGRRAPRGTYRVELSFVAADGAKASDKGSLKLTR